MDLFLHLISKKSAVSAGLSTYYTGVPCKRGHNALRRVVSSVCVACQVEFDRQRWIEKKDVLGSANLARHYEKRDERLSKRREAWASNADYYRAKHKEWARLNPGLVSAISAARKKHIKTATPPWADKKKISKFYVDARRVTSETGVEHHVDHIIPLRGRLVCGLHVPENLRVITATENVKKKNRWSPSS